MQTMPASTIAHTAPVPATWSMPGMMTNTDDAGVATDSVRNRTPAKPRLRTSGGAGAGVSCSSSMPRPVTCRW